MKSVFAYDQTLDDALRWLPHGAEFRFIDRLISLEPGKRGVGEYTVRGDERFLRGHFPGQPLFPGVLLVEAAAQLAGIVSQSDPNLPPLPGLKLTGIRSIKFFGAAIPSDVIRFEANVNGRLANLVQAEIDASVHGDIIMKGALALSATIGTAD